jgi:hypothetical protein
MNDGSTGMRLGSVNDETRGKVAILKPDELNALSAGILSRALGKMPGWNLLADRDVNV